VAGCSVEVASGNGRCGRMRKRCAAEVVPSRSDFPSPSARVTVAIKRERGVERRAQRRAFTRQQRERVRSRRYKERRHA